SPSGSERQGRCPLNAARSSSLHGWNHEFGAFFGACRPAGRYRLCLGVKTNRIWSMLIEVAEAGAFPSAEGVISERHRNRKVDSHHADLHAIDEIARSIAIARKDRHAISIFMLRWKLHRFLIVFGAHDRQNRSKNLFLVDSHIRLHVIEQAAAHEIAVL